MFSQWFEMLSVFVLSILTIVGVYSKTVEPDFLKPCKLRDNHCILEQWRTAIGALIEGRPELNIPPLDPIKVENVDIEVPGVTKLNFTGQLKGIKNCFFKEERTSIKQGTYKQTVKLNCENITLKGHYKAAVNGSAILGFVADGLLKADGKAKARIENLDITFILLFNIVKDEGEVKFVLKDGPVGYKYQVGGPATFAANNIYLADQDVSSLVVSFMNQNWKFILDNFGGPFFDKAFSIIGGYQKEFFSAVPAKSFFVDSLEEYVLDS